MVLIPYLLKWEKEETEKDKSSGSMKANILEFQSKTNFITIITTYLAVHSVKES